LQEEGRTDADPEHIVIIGNGIAGNSALSAIRRLDREVKITLVSEEEVPLYSPCLFYRYLERETERPRLFLKNLEDYSSEGANLILGHTATRIDVRSKDVIIGDENVHFDKLILATGSEALVPPIRGVDKKGVFALKTMNDADRISKYMATRVVVVGSGPIGLEAAISLRKRGAEVYLVEILDRVMPRLFDEAPSSILREILDSNGITVLTEERVSEIRGDGIVSSVATDRRQIKCDLVIMGAGVRPNVELARKAGLKIGDLGGVKTDDYGRTSAEDVYACGDCTESRDIISGQQTLSLLWHNAKRQGEVSGHNCAGRQRKYMGSIDCVNLEMFGNFATSMGKNSSSFNNDSSRYEVVERKKGSSYCRFTIVEDRIVGYQLISKGEGSGLLASSILRREKLSDLRRVTTDSRLLSMTPWRYRLRKYLD